MDKVFWPLEQDNNPHHQGLVSIKKLLKRDGTWDTQKIIIGRIIDTLNGPIKLPLSL